MSSPFEPNTWGPSLWRAIHFIALGFPSGSATEMQKEAYRVFFRNLDGVLPCSTCADNYREHLARHVSPVEEAIEAAATAEHPMALFDWTVQLHNVVNASLGKPSSTWTPEKAMRELSKLVPSASSLTSASSDWGSQMSQQLQQQQQQQPNHQHPSSSAGGRERFFALLVLAGGVMTIVITFLVRRIMNDIRPSNRSLKSER